MTFTEELEAFTNFLQKLEQEALKEKIVWLSVNPQANTGYGVQTRETVGRLIQKGYDITCIRGGGKQEWSPAEITTLELSNNEKVDVKVLPTQGDAIGLNYWTEYKKEQEFELLITLWDSFIINQYANYSESVEGIHYIPIDAPFTHKMYEMLKNANLVLAMSKFGYNELLKWFPIHKIAYIPHGIDCEIYYPYSIEKRKELRAHRGFKENDLVLISVVANAGIRKRIPVLLRVLAASIKQHKNIYLILVSNFDVPYYVGYDLKSIILESDLKDNVLLPNRDTFKQPYPIKEMVDLYNLADCYISTSEGEGFGLPLLEAMACGVPILVPDNSTMPELTNNGENGWLVQNVPNYITQDDLFGVPTGQSYPLPDEYLFRKTLYHVLNHSEERLEKGEHARNFVLANYDWSKVLLQWQILIANQMEKIILKTEIKEELNKQLIKDEH